MNGAAGEKQEAEKRIKEYIQASSMSLSKKQSSTFFLWGNPIIYLLTGIVSGMISVSPGSGQVSGGH